MLVYGLQDPGPDNIAMLVGHVRRAIIANKFHYTK